MEADGEDYPKSIIPILPSVNFGAFQFRGEVAEGSAFFNGVESYMQGRYALLEAMRRAGVGPGTSVLMPAFHCRSMVEPVLFLNSTVCFYSINNELQPDFQALSLLLRESRAAVGAMVLTHYFGFPNALEEAERFCDLHGITLIEDCAHALYGQVGGRLLGTVGSYAIASPWKFLPVRDGGVLRDNTGGGISPRIEQPWLTEIKAVAAMLQTGVQHVSRRCPVIDSVTICEQEAKISASGRAQFAEQEFKELVVAHADFSALRSSRWGMRHAAHGRVARLRRKNYLRWQEGVRDLAGVKPLFPSLPDGVVPYVFPLLVDAAGMGFHLFKLVGIPLWRWEDMAVTDCAVSRDYRIRLLQLPCHQELSEEELAWMIDTVRLLAHCLDTGSEREEN